ncbi:uncharacterized protein SOCE26_090530 [Sorangium cellulosum]|uniref:Uncharacterized protein n=1 Tax=Sorangium cellulosum TaxID=56 RepID=A0A2L0F7N8_SORCE|nr:DUF1427 family protein [Sorangium cellulosum]AUX47532.1 uncharacterized protein SOCE26_090530 [Sorangium cellulosum]
MKLYLLSLGVGVLVGILYSVLNVRSPAPPGDKTLKLYEGHFHDLLNDLGKEQVVADVVGWINARVA